MRESARWANLAHALLHEYTGPGLWDFDVATTASHEASVLMKKALGQDDAFEIWPDFESQYEVQEYSWTTLGDLGEVLLLNCGRCDGPSDLRHEICKSCIDERKRKANDAYKIATGQSKEKWMTLILCRIHTE